MSTTTVSPKPKSTVTPDQQQAIDNPYLRMPLDRVRADAEHGVRLAREAWRERDPDGANLALGHVIQPNSSKPRRGTRKRRDPKY